MNTQMIVVFDSCEIVAVIDLLPPPPRFCLSLFCIIQINLRNNRNMSSSQPSKPAAVVHEATARPISVPTVFHAPFRQVDLTSISNAGLAALKKNDAFSYYSIPNVRRATFHGQRVDSSSLAASLTSARGRRRTTVTRRTRLATECHPDVGMKELLLKEGGASCYQDWNPQEGESNDDEWGLYSYLESLQEMATESSSTR
jgi:hypothetical protein